MKTANKITKIEFIKGVVRDNRLVDDRVELLERFGFKVEKSPMGSGGVLQKRNKNGKLYLQIGYGYSKHNYAMCVIFNSVEELSEPFHI